MISFKEVANTTGISYLGESYGSSWGDFNNDTYPDLYLSNHQAQGILYLNQGDGTFVDITSQVFLPELDGDAHGAAWADFDNDGDHDLIQLVGGGRGTGAGPNQMYVNEGGKLEDRASELGIDYPLSRGRTPLWFDLDKDGLLDLFAGANPRPDGQSPPTIFRQTSDGFEDANSITGFDLTNSSFSLLSNLSGEGNLDAIFNSSPLTFYDISSIPFQDITSTVLAISPDIATGDFNGDLLPDLYITRNSSKIDDLSQDQPDSLKVRLVSKTEEKGIQFNSSGEVIFNLLPFPFDISASNVYIGEKGFNPNGLEFSLSANDPEVEGILPHTPGSNLGIYIGYDSSQQRWQLLLSTPEHDTLSGIIQTSEPITELTPIGFEVDSLSRNDQLWINDGQGFKNLSKEAGLDSIAIEGHSVVTGDFDNDMDEDIYIVATRPVENQPNILYENQGDGTFIAVPSAGGAAGSNLGLGDSVTTADYDMDGFLDLFVTNGNWPPLFRDDGPYQLFRNQGNNNHWLKIDLEGVVSNRDGIGAQVFVTAGGVTQLREQSGGIHHRSQNHQRLHFGLADNTRVDEIRIRWPNGQEQVINDVAADQLLKIIEPSESFTSGKPGYKVGSESGIFLWKDTFDGPYHLRTVSTQDSTQFHVNLISTDRLLEVTPFSLETNDNLAESDFGFSLNSRLSSGQDGLDFRLAPGAKALFSVTQDGVANPRQLNLGKQAAPLSPDGWIIDSEEFSQRPDFSPGADLGLFVGQGNSPEKLEFRWNGDDNLHQAKLSVLSSDDRASFSTVNLEPNDEIINLNNGLTIEGTTIGKTDGLDLTTPEPVQIGFAYEQDSILQPHRVNPDSQDDLLNDPNAYWLPLATPYGQPEYDHAEESGLFLWKEEQGLWHLRVTAGADLNRRYVGSIVSDSPATSVTDVSLESNDQVNTNDPLRIDFDLRVFKGNHDGIDFSFPADASLTINLEGAPKEAASLFQIGSERWSVSEVPLDISSW